MIGRTKVRLQDILQHIFAFTIQLPIVEEFRRHVYETLDCYFVRAILKSPKHFSCIDDENHAALLHCTTELLLSPLISYYKCTMQLRLKQPALPRNLEHFRFDYRVLQRQTQHRSQMNN